MDFDPRDYDSRDDERFAPHRGRSGNSDRDDHEREDDPRQPDIPSRDREDSDVRQTAEKLWEARFIAEHRRPRSQGAAERSKGGRKG